MFRPTISFLKNSSVPSDLLSSVSSVFQVYGLVFWLRLRRAVFPVFWFCPRKPSMCVDRRRALPTRTICLHYLIDFFKEFMDADGLADIAIHAGIEAALPVAFHGMGGHGDDGRVAIRRQLMGAND